MGLMGKKIHYGYYFSKASNVWTAYFNDDVTVSEAIEVPEVTDKPPISQIDITDDRITFSFFDTGFFTQASFNGPIFEDREKTLEPIAGISLQTNMDGLTRSDIEVSEDRLAIDLHGLGFMPDTYIRITLKFGPDRIVGTDKDETLKGTDANEWILGDGGKDSLYGMGGNDIFAFEPGDVAKDKARADTIFDFGGDKIDLKKIDANARTARDDAFSFLGEAEFTRRAGQLRVEKEKSDTWISADMTGDGKADLVIRLDDAVDLAASSFYL